jgi:hypothetical protein
VLLTSLNDEGEKRLQEALSSGASPAGMLDAGLTSQ